MRLYDFPFSGNGYKVRLTLRWLGIPFEYRVVDILAGESRTEAFLDKSSFGQVPVLELDDGTCPRESTAILMYLAEGTPLLPTDKLLRTRVLEWMNTIADIALYAYTHCAGQGGLDLTPYVSLRAWFDRVREQRAYLSIDDVPGQAA